MTLPKIQKPFTHSFLNQFVLASSLLPFSDEEIYELDQDLNQYEQLFLDPDIEKNLISKNELLASFAISKAENSALTLAQAESVYDFVLNSKEYTFISEKLKAKKPLNQKDYEKLEFYNIAKTFRTYNQNPVGIQEITPEYVKELHRQLTQGLDIFKDYLTDVHVYKAGKWRDTDDIRIDTYIPAPHNDVPKGVEELLIWIKGNQTPTSVGLFHIALYALHPFTNGNKRVCRVLEHILLRSLKLNTKNLYSTSYYYHKEKERYYKYLFNSLVKTNLNHFVGFFQEAMVLSIVSVIKTSLESKRKEYLDKSDLTDNVKSILKPLIKRNEMQFNNLISKSKGKVARQTFVTYLQQSVEKGFVTRREDRGNTYYKLNVLPEEEQVLANLLERVKPKLSYIPDEIKLA